MKSDDKKVVTEVTPSSFDKGAFDRFMDRAAPKMSEGGQAGGAMRRREATCTIDHRMCEPGYFDAAFQITVSSLTSADELDALKAAGSETSIGHVMAKRSVRSMNGRPLSRVEVDLLWEALGFSGRVAVMNLFTVHCTGADGASLGKSLNSVEIG